MKRENVFLTHKGKNVMQWFLVSRLSHQLNYYYLSIQGKRKKEHEKNASFRKDLSNW